MQTHKHLEQPAVVRDSFLSVPVGVVHLVPPAGQQQLIRAVKGGWIYGVAVKKADQVLPVMFPGCQKIIT